MGYEDDFLEYLESLIRDLDRRIQRGKNRLQLSVTANVKVGEAKERDSQLNCISHLSMVILVKFSSVASHKPCIQVCHTILNCILYF